VAELGLGDGVAVARASWSANCACSRRHVFRLECFGNGLLGAVLALEGLVSHTLAELLDTVDLLRLEAVEGLLLLVSAFVREAILRVE
jgi:hypothetical protein